MHRSSQTHRFGWRIAASPGSALRCAVRAAAVLLGLILTGSVHATEAAAQWRFETMPFLWAAGQDGTIDFEEFHADLDIGFGDLIGEVDGALMLPVVGRNGRWGLRFEIVYVDISDQDADVSDTVIETVDYQANHRIMELVPSYSVFKVGPASVDVVAGGRYTRVENTFTFGGDSIMEMSLELQDRWIEPLIGVQAAGAVKRWTFAAHGDIGGFGVGADFTWQAFGYVGYTFSPRLTIRGGYRHFDTDFEDRDDNFIFDVAMSGPMIGASFRF